MANINSVNSIPPRGQGVDITQARLAAFNNKYGTYSTKTHSGDMEMFRVDAARPGAVRQMEPRKVSWLDKAIRWVKGLFVKDTAMQETSRAFYDDVSTAFGGAEKIPPRVKAAMGEHCKEGGVEKPLLLCQVRSVQSLAREALDRKMAETNEIQNAAVQRKPEKGETGEVQSQGEKQPIRGKDDEERKIKDEKHVNSHKNLTEEQKEVYKQREERDERVEKERDAREEKMTPKEREEAENEERENIYYAQQNPVDAKMARQGVRTTLKQDLAEHGFGNIKTSDNNETSQVLYERYKKFGVPHHEKSGKASFFTSRFHNGSGKPGTTLKQDLAKHGIVEHEVIINEDDTDGALLNETLKERYTKFGDQDQGGHDLTEFEIAHFAPRFRGGRGKSGSVGGE